MFSSVHVDTLNRFLGYSRFGWHWNLLANFELARWKNGMNLFTFHKIIDLFLRLEIPIVEHGAI